MSSTFLQNAGNGGLGWNRYLDTLLKQGLTQIVGLLRSWHILIPGYVFRSPMLSGTTLIFKHREVAMADCRLEASVAENHQKALVVMCRQESLVAEYRQEALVAECLQESSVVCKYQEEVEAESRGEAAEARKHQQKATMEFR
ncbi:hypothetical protein NTG1052_450015 [Candidatus Nitrotoga sp. 1052]|nr:hypothetical protein NTG1052_450015 [Candidatus Nitrotoga sp. 1052]